MTYDKSASYFVTIPKTIVLDSNKESTYSVKVEGDIPSDKNVYVAPVDAISQTNEIDFYMKDQSTKNIKADVVATVTHNKDTWDFEDASSGYEETNNSISALGLSSGEWKGTFNFNINLRDVANSGDDKKDDANYGEDVTLTSDNFATYGIANTGDVVIPSEVVDSEGVKHKVTSIGDSAFMKCSNLTSITIPDSVTNIGTHAFQNCSSLKSITIPDSVTNIGDYAFCNCSSLKSITIPDGVTSIGDKAFNCCTGVTTITIPKSVTNIGKDAFSICRSVSSIVVDSNNPIYDSRNDCNTIIETSTNTLIKGCNNTIIPNSVASIGDGAFWSCTRLITITIPESVISIGDDAFCHCESLKSITIPEGVTSIGNSTFFYCNGLTSITIPESVTSIGNYAFKTCESLTSITIPNSVKSIGMSAFDYCSKLSYIFYKGTTYTNKTRLTNALSSNGVSVGYAPFTNTKLQ